MTIHRQVSAAAGDADKHCWLFTPAPKSASKWTTATKTLLEGWSVLVQGHAHEVTDERQLKQLEDTTRLKPWARRGPRRVRAPRTDPDQRTTHPTKLSFSGDKAKAQAR